MSRMTLRRVAVIGVGMSKFGKQPEKGLVDLGTEACIAAIKDAAINPKHIEGCYCANSFGEMHCIGQDIASKVGVVNREMVRVENACAGGSTAVRETFLAVATGRYDIGLAIGVDSMTTCVPKGPMASNKDIDGELGLTAPGYAALQMRRHMEKYGSTNKQFALVSVKNHHNGSLNPYAMYQQEMTLEEVLGSRMVCDPLTLYMICPFTDGAAAVIFCSEDKVAQYTSTPVWMVGSALRSGDYSLFWKEIDASPMGEQVAAEAYELAGLGPKDLDLVELHDAFAGCEISNTEDLGLCPRGEGGVLIEEGATALGGRIPVSPSGGLLAQGHPLSASGVRQVCEITWQLRGQAGKRQVDGAKVGLAHMEGGIVSGIQGGACGINIFTR